MENLHDLSAASLSREITSELLRRKNVRIEKIVSMGQVSGEWYDQDEGEWVCVISGSGELVYEDGGVQRLSEGEHCYIPPHKKHRVAFCSSPCLWLCVFIGG